MKMFLSKKEIKIIIIKKLQLATTNVLGGYNIIVIITWDSYIN